MPFGNAMATATEVGHIMTAVMTEQSHTGHRDYKLSKTATGTLLFVFVPLPSSPNRLGPQQ